MEFILKVFRVFVLLITIIISLSSVNAYDLSEYPSPFIKNGKFDGVLVVGDTAPAEEVIALSDIIASLQFLVLDRMAKDNVGIDSLYEGQTRTYSFGNIYYEVTLSFVNTETAQFIINGMTTKILLPNEFERLPDGKILTLVGIKNDNGLYAILAFSDRELDAKDILIEVGTAKLASEVENIQKVNSILVGHACNNPLVAVVSGRTDCKGGYEKNVGLIETYEMPNGKVSLVVTGYSTKDTLNAANVLSYFQDYKNNLKGEKVKVMKKGGKLIVEQYFSDDTKKSYKKEYNNNFGGSIIIFLILVIMLIILIFITKKKTKAKK
ncbi:hypothetical protein HYX02_05290 [Candidatus Woesearchaeota archaeon]|nr:hypothetical protein [Candidatus Woesearchaeota archaeon]